MSRRSRAGRGPTGPQQRYLANLARRKGVPYPSGLTAAEASRVIAAWADELGDKPTPKPGPVTRSGREPGAVEVQQVVIGVERMLNALPAAQQDELAGQLLEELSQLAPIRRRLEAQDAVALEEAAR